MAISLSAVDISECLHGRYGFVSVSLQNIDPMRSEAIALRKVVNDSATISCVEVASVAILPRHSDHTMLDIFKIERMDVRLQVPIELSPSRLTFQAPTVRKKCPEVARPRDISIRFRPSFILLVLDLVSFIETFLHPLAE